MRKFIFLFLLIALTLPIFASAQINLNLNYPEFGNVTLDKDKCDKIVAKDPSVEGEICGQNLNIVLWLYYLIVGIAGLAAFVMLVWGGIQWLTSGAIPSQASEAKDKVKSAVLGLLLILASFLIIQVINPQLTILSQPGLQQFFGEVPQFEGQGPTPNQQQPPGGDLPAPPPPGTKPAFPGAEGFGAQALATCDKTDIKVIEVINLSNSGAGSFRDAVENQLRDGKLDIIIFRTGGTINGGGGRIENSCVYIAGQTAPGDGVQVKATTGLSVDRAKAHNIVVRYMRFRSNKGTGDTLDIFGGHDIIFDHVSAQWGNDEVFSINPGITATGKDIYDVTVQRTIIAECLLTHCSGSIVGANSKPLAPRTYNISLHHNTWTHSDHRTPNIDSTGTQLANNIIYNWNGRLGNNAGGAELDLVKNAYIKGPWTSGDSSFGTGNSSWHRHASCNQNDPLFPDTPSYHFEGNFFGSYGESLVAHTDQWSHIVQRWNCPDSVDQPFDLLPTVWQRSTPILNAPIPVNVQSLVAGYNSVLADVGANKNLTCNGDWVNTQDRVDKDLINDIKNGTAPFVITAAMRKIPGPGTSPANFGGHPNLASGTPCTDTDSDGMPDAWESRYFGSNTAANIADDPDGDKYTNIEEYLNGTNPIE
jgi:pectate lyase